MVEALGHSTKGTFNQNTVKVPKVVKPSNKTLGTSVINSPMSPSSLCLLCPPSITNTQITISSYLSRFFSHSSLVTGSHPSKFIKYYRILSSRKCSWSVKAAAVVRKCQLPLNILSFVAAVVMC